MTKRRGWMGAGRRMGVWTALLALWAGSLAAQVPVVGGGTGAPVGGARGPQFYGVFGSASYNNISTTAVGIGAPGVPDTLKTNDYLGMLGGTVGWAAGGPKTNFAVTYSPFYFGSVRNPDASSLNHMLNLSTGTPRRLSRKWTFDLGLMANIFTFNAFMFTPLGIANGAVTGSNLGDLSNAMIRKEIRTDGLASALSGGGTLDSATRVLYGGRSLSAGALGSFTYQYSQRLSVSFGVGAARTQNLAARNTSNRTEPNFEVAVPYANNFTGQAQLSYSLTPQTTIGVSTQANRSFTGQQDSWATNTRALVGHTFRSWFLSAYGGIGAITPVKAVYVLKLGPQISAGGVAGYQRRGNVFLVNADRSVGDTFGIGGFANTTTNAAWYTLVPGSTWSFGASFGYQTVHSVGAADLTGWRGGANVQKYIGSGFSMFFGYAGFYARSDFSPQQFRLRVHTARIGLNWSPYAERGLQGPGQMSPGGANPGASPGGPN